MLLNEAKNYVNTNDGKVCITVARRSYGSFSVAHRGLDLVYVLPAFYNLNLDINYKLRDRIVMGMHYATVNKCFLKTMSENFTFNPCKK